MANPMRLLRACLPALTGAAALAFTVPAGAQSACGAQYTVQPGDTLSHIARHCRVPMSRIMDLNPGLDPRSMEVGRTLRLEAAAQARAPAGEQTYRVREGDTPASIAQRLGLSFFELLASGEDLDDLQPGDLLDVPGSDRRAAFSIEPHSGPVGASVQISARDLRPDDWVTIGAGTTASQWRRVTEAHTTAEGRLDTAVDVPRWAEPGERLIFVVDTDYGVTLKSDDFRVTGDRFGDGRRMTLEGRIGEGVECHTLTTPRGTEYALIGGDVRFVHGEYVEIAGHRVEASVCQQGEATIDVDEIREIAPPDGRPDERVQLRGWVEQGVECPILRASDGQIYALTGPNVDAHTGEFVELEGRRADVSFCMQGEGTIEVMRIANR